MPQGTPVSNCVNRLMAMGYSQSEAIAICQAATDQSYQTGKPLQ